jgi:hypothetical protein
MLRQIAANLACKGFTVYCMVGTSQWQQEMYRESCGRREDKQHPSQPEGGGEPRRWVAGGGGRGVVRIPFKKGCKQADVSRAISVFGVQSKCPGMPAR